MSEAPDRSKEQETRIFVCNDFHGHWPVGTAAVIVAVCESDARRYLVNELERRGLCTNDFTLRDITGFVGAEVLCDGNY